MGILECRYCGARAEADTVEAADDLIDHARGKAIGRPCPGEPSELRWNGSIVFEKKYVRVLKSSSSKSKTTKATAPKPKPKPTPAKTSSSEQQEEDTDSKTAL